MIQTGFQYPQFTPTQSNPTVRLVVCFCVFKRCNIAITHLSQIASSKTVLIVSSLVEFFRAFTCLSSVFQYRSAKFPQRAKLASSHVGSFPCVLPCFSIFSTGWQNKSFFSNSHNGPSWLLSRLAEKTVSQYWPVCSPTKFSRPYKSLSFPVWVGKILIENTNGAKPDWHQSSSCKAVSQY